MRARVTRAAKVVIGKVRSEMPVMEMGTCGKQPKQ